MSVYQLSDPQQLHRTVTSWISQGRIMGSRMMQGWGKWLRYAGLLICLCLMSACQNGMEDQAKFEPYEANPFFANGTSARPLMANTVARGQLQEDAHLARGLVNGAPAEEFPFPITEDVLARGQERYNIYCTPCHGYAGNGDGIIVQRGFTPPPSFHSERLRLVPVGHIFNVITNGIGVMYSYGDRIDPNDRWAIIAYVRALQLSQNATLENVPADLQQSLPEASDESATTTEPERFIESETVTESAPVTGTEAITNSEETTETE